eukprot:6202183-Pleurochrysis_carterae.AAC.1
MPPDGMQYPGAYCLSYHIFRLAQQLSCGRLPCTRLRDTCAHSRGSKRKHSGAAPRGLAPRRRRRLHHDGPSHLAASVPSRARLAARICASGVRIAVRARMSERRARMRGVQGSGFRRLAW